MSFLSLLFKGATGPGRSFIDLFPLCSWFSCSHPSTVYDMLPNRMNDATFGHIKSPESSLSLVSLSFCALFLQKTVIIRDKMQHENDSLSSELRSDREKLANARAEGESLRSKLSVRFWLWSWSCYSVRFTVDHSESAVFGTLTKLRFRPPLYL